MTPRRVSRRRTLAWIALGATLLMLGLGVKAALGVTPPERPQASSAPSSLPSAVGLASLAESAVTNERVEPSAERRVQGRTVVANGHPCAAELDLADAALAGAAVHVRSDAAGTFTAVVPVTWSKAGVRATAAGGRSGALEVALAAHDGATTTLPDLMLHRRIEFELTLQVADLTSAMGGFPLAGTVLVELEDQPRGFHSRNVAVTTFPSVANDRHTVAVEVPGDQNLLRWIFATPSGSRFLLQGTAVPDDAARFADTCRIDATSVLAGRAVDPDGRAVGGLPLVFDQTAPVGQRVEIDTEPDGTFRTVVALGAHGNVHGAEADDSMFGAGVP